MRKVSLAVAALVLAAGIRGHADEPSGPFKVIVNPRVAGRKITRDALAQIYLGTAQRWGDGSPIVAIDLSSTSPVREAFSRAVLGMSVDAVKAYWLRSISGGKRPPMIKGSDQEVMAFVAAEPGGVGYIADSTPAPATVRVVWLQ